MPRLIIHKDGAYNIYTTVADGACYESALTLEQLTEVLRFEGGQAAIDALPARLERAHRTGCSSWICETLAECIACNRAGLSFDEFVARYLTLPKQDGGSA